MSDGRPPAFAFFDVDGTLISIKSMFSFQEYYHCRWRDGATAAGRSRYEDFQATMARMQADGSPREAINAAYYEYFAGRDPDDVARCARTWFAAVTQEVPGLYLTRPVAVLKRHRDEGIEPVFVSGSSIEILAPLAEALGVRHVLATRLEVADGRFTGRIRPPQTIGAGKAEAVRRFLAQAGADGRVCRAYGDDRSDIPMLEQVGYPHAIGGDPILESHAHALGWPIL